LAIGDAAYQADHRNVYGLVALSLQASQHIRPLDAVCSRPPSKGAGFFLRLTREQEAETKLASNDEPEARENSLTLWRNFWLGFFVFMT